MNIAGYLTFLNISADDNVVVIAHRGASGTAPENTLAALEIAIRQKADYAEIDVQRTSDGTIVVVHDQDLMKLARDPRRIDQTRIRICRRLISAACFTRILSRNGLPDFLTFFQRRQVKSGCSSNLSTTAKINCLPAKR